MKISTFILLIGILCIFYIYNAEWIDEWYETFVEDYVGSDYEEVAPFVSSVESGTEEFDHSIEESNRFFKENNILTPYAITFTFALLTVLVLIYQSIIVLKENAVVRSTQNLLNRYCNSFSQTKDDVVFTRKKENVHNLLTEFLERNIQGYRNRKPGEEVPVQLLWKKGSIVESSVHCNLREREHQKSSELGGGDDVQGNVLRTSSEESTTAKIAEIRRLLESEPEIIKNFVDKCAGNEEVSEEMINHLRQRLESELSLGSKNGKRTEVTAQTAIPQQLSPRVNIGQNIMNKAGLNRETVKKENLTPTSEELSTDADNDLEPDPKLMNRIRILESRLRLEELKNQNWINRMARAEEILHQLNKQVERIEESRPLETRTEMLKITTSTVTNWMPGTHPKRNMQYTLVNPSPLHYLQQPYMSLSDIIKKEVGLPPSGEYSRNRIPMLPPMMQIPQLPSPTTTLQPYFFSRLLSK